MFVKKAALFGCISLLALCVSTPAHPVDIPVVRIHARRYEFVPAVLTLKKGQPVKLELISDDVLHSLRIDGLGVNTRMPVGQTVETTVTPAEKGKYQGRCGIFCGNGHGRMALEVHVVDAD